MRYPYAAVHLVWGALFACSATPEPPARGSGVSTGASGGALALAAGGANQVANGGAPAASGGQSFISLTSGGSAGALGAATAQGAGGKCGSAHVDAQVKSTEIVTETPGNVLFVFDQSRSMEEDWNGSSKLQVAVAAVRNAFAPLAEKLSAGAILFPAPPNGSTPTCSWLNTSACSDLCPDVVGIAQTPQISLRRGNAFLTAWAAMGASSGSTVPGTPTEKALLQAEAALASPPVGGTALVLVTDGQPTCGDNEAAIAARLLTRGIKTYVVGLPGAQGAAALDRIAIAGGTAAPGCTSACYLYPDDPQALERALALVATRVVTTETRLSIDACQFDLSPAAGADPNDVHLLVNLAPNGERFEVPRDASNGWTLSSDQRSATLLGGSCEAAKNGQFTAIEFEYGCVTVPVLPR